jgi:NHL repeat
VTGAGASRTIAHPARRAGRVGAVLAAAAGTLLVLLVFSASASALSQQGHEFVSSFGGGELSKPSAVAVNETTGEIYVLDTGHNRVMVYNAEHKFVAAWGAGVGKSGEKSYEVCTSECKAGVAGYGKGEFDEPVAIAVDNAKGSPSNGDVYVVANHTGKKAVIDKLKPSGELIDRLAAGKEERSEFEENPIVGVAVGPTGMVWVEREAEEEEIIIQRFGNGVQNAQIGEPAELNYGNVGETEEPLSGPVRPGFAVDAQGSMFVTYEPEGHTRAELEEEEEEIKEREKERKQEHEPLLGEKPQLPCEKHPCLAVRFENLHTEADEQVWARFANNPLTFESSSGLGADDSSGTPSSGNSFVAERTSVTAFSASGAEIQNFGSGHIGEAKGLAVYSNCGAPCSTGSDEVLVADAGHGEIDLFEPSKPSVPTITSESPTVAHVKSESAELRATVDPDGAEAHYRFQYGPTPCSEPGACREAPEPPAGAGVVGSGFGDRGVEQTVSGLSPATVYHVRIVVEYSLEGGKVKGSLPSEERTFTTASATTEAALPDGRKWELVSPPNKHGASVEPSGPEGGVVQAAADGEAIAYMSSGPFGENEPEGYRGPERSQMFATRSADGWSTRDLATPNTGALGGRPGLPREYQFFSSDLESGLLQPEDDTLLSPKASEPTIYLRHDDTCVADPAECFEPLVTGGSEGNATSKERFGSSIVLDGATPDGKHVLISSIKQLTEGGPKSGLWEWTGGVLTPVSFLPGGKPTEAQVFLGAGTPVGDAVGRMTATAVSHDGNRVEWYEEKNPHLYTRDISAEQTLQVDEPEKGLTPKQETPATFQTASADGSKIFFTDDERLTSNSEAPENGKEPDLYVFEPEKEAGHRVTDLSVPLASGEGGAVQGAVIGTSEDGRVVYFVANGVLAPGATRGNCGSPSGSGCNLYVVENVNESWGPTEFVGRLSIKDNPDWGEPLGEGLYHMQLKTSQVSGNGKYVAFMSENSLTGYNNVDVNSGFHDEEVFLFERSLVPKEGGGEEVKSRLLCPSCNPSGAQPLGVLDTRDSGEGNGLLVDRPETWQGSYTETTARWLSGSLPGWTAYAKLSTNYQPRYLDNDGRLFFNSADALVPRDDNGKMDVYEWEPEGIGGCAAAQDQGGCVALISQGENERESTFLDASESGNDVFFLTSAKLSTLDEDTADDIYDARVCGVPGFEACATLPSPPPAPCSEEETCKGRAPEPESYEAPTTSTIGPSGNVAQGVLGTKTEAPKETKKTTPKLTKAQELAKALKACHKDKSKSKRVACEKTARKRYGAKKASHSKLHRAHGARAARRHR